MNSKVTENPFKNRRGEVSLFVIVTSLFISLYLVSNMMAVKVVGFFDIFCFDAGTITFPLTYMLGDVLTEIWGYRTTRRVIWMTLICNVLMVVCTQIGVWMPSPDYLAESEAAYNLLFDYVPRIVLGSLAGFLLGELSNSWIMERMKRMTKGRYLWLRMFGSSVVGYLMDSVPFVVIAYAGIVSTRDLLMMILLQYVLKLGIEAIFGTPLAYMFVGWIKRHTSNPDEAEKCS